jgi:hypothetical protein
MGKKSGRLSVFFSPLFYLCLLRCAPLIPNLSRRSPSHSSVKISLEEARVIAASVKRLERIGWMLWMDELTDPTADLKNTYVDGLVRRGDTSARRSPTLIYRI